MEMERMRALVLAKPKKAARGELYAFWDADAVVSDFA